MILRLTKKLALNLRLSSAHFGYGPLKPLHGPQHWPWWKLVVPKMYSIDGIAIPSTGKRIWFYTRRGAPYLDIIFDRRGVVSKFFQL